MYWTLADHQGSVRDVATFDGVETTHFEHVEFDSYGRIVEVKRNVGGVVVVDATNTPTAVYAYTGREWDAATDLQYNRNRWYDAEFGRWLSEDRIGIAGGDANLYGYVGYGATIGTVLTPADCHSIRREAGQGECEVAGRGSTLNQIRGVRKVLEYDGNSARFDEKYDQSAVRDR